jgi:hypothetical protein
MKINLRLDYQTILANQAQPVHFALQFQADSIAAPRPKPAAFCVVLDRSGSMTGAPLERAKEATSLAIRLDQGYISSRDSKIHRMRQFYAQRSSSRLPPGPDPFASPPAGSPPPPAPDKPGPGPVA